MKTIELALFKGEWLTHALKRGGYSNIPSNTILDKTLPGLGATYGEIHSQRHSIIIEPNVPVILGKVDKDQNMLAVYEHCTKQQIKTFLKTKDDNTFKKILTTPEGFKKIRKAAKEVGVNIYEDFFCLFDECEKLTQDVNFRRLITQPIYDFFQFRNKAFVSATPLDIPHPEFEKQGFVKLKVVPQYDYKKDLELIVTNSFQTTLVKYFESYRDSKCICIFLNSTDGIMDIINLLGIKDYKIYCSDKSVKKLQKTGVTEAYSSVLDSPFSRVNFLTCRFYSAVDITIRNKRPDVLMLTDMRTQYTMIDPFTEAIQIPGRFRKSPKIDFPYNSLTHLTTVNSNLRIRTEEEIVKRVEQFRKNYEALKDQHDKESDPIFKEAIFEDMVNLKLHDLLDDTGNINPFAIANLYNEERVKSYYQSGETLLEAYNKTGHFNVTYTYKMEIIGDDDMQRIANLKNKTDKRRQIVFHLEKLNTDFQSGIITKGQKDYYSDILGKDEEGAYTIMAYQKIGISGFEKANYSKTEIDKQCKMYDRERVEVLRFGKPVLAEIKNEFELNIPIPAKEIQQRLSLIFHEFSLDYKVTQTTIKEYFDAHQSNSKSGYPYILKAFKFE